MTIFVTPMTHTKSMILGQFEADGQTIFFKIDYFDKTLTYHSPDPSPNLAIMKVRVRTNMGFSSII